MAFWTLLSTTRASQHARWHRWLRLLLCHAYAPHAAARSTWPLPGAPWRACMHARTCRGNYDGPEPERLAALKYAALRGAPYVDVEFKAIQFFFAGGA